MLRVYRLSCQSEPLFPQVLLLWNLVCILRCCSKSVKKGFFDYVDWNGWRMLSYKWAGSFESYGQT